MANATFIEHLLELILLHSPDQFATAADVLSYHINVGDCFLTSESLKIVLKFLTIWYLVKFDDRKLDLTLLEYLLCLKAEGTIRLGEHHYLAAVNHFLDTLRSVEFHFLGRCFFSRGSCYRGCGSGGHFAFDRVASDGHQIDAVPVALEIW